MISIRTYQDTYLVSHATRVAAETETDEIFIVIFFNFYPPADG